MRKIYKRGPYHIYTEQIKEIALNKLRNGNSFKSVSDEMEIPVKNIRRWWENGCVRKKGGGRKVMDQEMECNLYNWCINYSNDTGRRVSRKMIRQMALRFSKPGAKFKASKGWTDKFVRKYGLRKNIRKKGMIKFEEVEEVFFDSQ